MNESIPNLFIPLIHDKLQLRLAISCLYYFTYVAIANANEIYNEYDVLTIIQLLLAFKQISAHSGWILQGAQRVLDAVDQGAEVVESLKDLGPLVQHWKVRILIHLWNRMKQSQNGLMFALQIICD